MGLGAADVERERADIKDTFAKLHAHLSLGSVPQSLPCRDEERKRLSGFLNRALHEGACRYTVRCCLQGCLTAAACKESSSMRIAMVLGVCFKACGVLARYVCAGCADICLGLVLLQTEVCCISVVYLALARQPWSWSCCVG